VANRFRGEGEPGDGFEERMKTQIMFFGNRKKAFFTSQNQKSCIFAK
jgi:hypothetical protein